MRYVAAYALAVLGGKSTPTAEDIDRILSSVGVEKNQEKIDLIIKLFANRKVEDLIREGGVKLASVPFGGSGGSAVAAASPAAQTSDAKPAAEQKKEEKVEKEDSESDDDMGFGLFD